MLTPLEGLLAAEATLSGKEEFLFSNWSLCTCGHVYHGVTGEWAPRSMSGRYTVAADLVKMSPDYSRVIIETAKALGWTWTHQDNEEAVSASAFISNMTEFTAIDCHHTREAALQIVRRAIKKLRELDVAKVGVVNPHEYELPVG